MDTPCYKLRQIKDDIIDKMKITITITRIQDYVEKHGQMQIIHYIKSKKLPYVRLNLTRLSPRYLYLQVFLSISKILYFVMFSLTTMCNTYIYNVAILNLLEKLIHEECNIRWSSNIMDKINNEILELNTSPKTAKIVKS